MLLPPKKKTKKQGIKRNRFFLLSLSFFTFASHLVFVAVPPAFRSLLRLRSNDFAFLAAREMLETAHTSTQSHKKGATGEKSEECVANKGNYVSFHFARRMF